MQYLQPGPHQGTSPGLYGTCKLHRNMQYHIQMKMIIWCHQSGSSMFTAVDAVLVLRISPARDNTKCRHCLFHFQWVHQLWIYPYLLSILIAIPFSSTHHSFGITYTYSTDVLHITNCKLSALCLGVFFWCFCTCLCCILYMLQFCTLYVLLFGEHVCRPSLLCNPYPLTKKYNNESQ